MKFSLVTTLVLGNALVPTLAFVPAPCPAAFATLKAVNGARIESTQSPTSLASGQGFGKNASARKKKGSWKDAPSAGLASDLPYSSPEVSAAASGKGEESLPTIPLPSDQTDLIEKLRAEIKLAEDKIVSESKGRADAEKVADDVKGQKDIAEKMAEQRCAAFETNPVQHVFTTHSPYHSLLPTHSLTPVPLPTGPPKPPTNRL